jgi:hypothetical protein
MIRVRGYLFIEGVDLQSAHCANKNQNINGGVYFLRQMLLNHPIFESKDLRADDLSSSEAPAVDLPGK